MMTPYLSTLLALLGALLGQALAAGLAFELALRRQQTGSERAIWFALFLSSMLLALHHGYTLELALRTGLFDLRQAVLSVLASSLFALGLYGLRRRQS